MLRAISLGSLNLILAKPCEAERVLDPRLDPEAIEADLAVHSRL